MAARVTLAQLGGVIPARHERVVVSGDSPLETGNVYLFSTQRSAAADALVVVPGHGHIDLTAEVLNPRALTAESAQTIPTRRPDALGHGSAATRLTCGSTYLRWSGRPLSIQPRTARLASECLTGDMPLVGDYEPSPSARSRNQVETYETSGGTDGLTLGDTGLPVIVVTSRGAKSGKLRKTPLMRVEYDGVYAAVGSMGGAPNNPVWVYNLRAESATVLQDGPSTFDLVAREISGAERDVWWDRCVAAYPPYAEYQTRTDRLIPVFLLEPAS